MTRGSRVSFRRRYGASPLHLLGHLLGFAIAVFALDRIFSGGDVKELVMWYLGFVIAHDLIFVSVYAGLDRLLRGALARLPRPSRTGLPVINHVRAPVLISGLLLIIYLPVISGRSDGQYLALSGHHLTHYLRNWLLITGTLFLGSGLLYALRFAKARAGQAR
ncbi:MAG: hypothetical protein ABI323_00855 [Solirubrobacteraceae bacterium]